MNAEEIQSMTEETIEGILDIVEVIDARHNSRWKRVSKPEIDYLLSTIGSLCTIVLELSGNLVRSKSIIALKDTQILSQKRQINALAVKVTQQAGEIAFLKQNPVLKPEINQKEEK